MKHTLSAHHSDVLELSDWDLLHVLRGGELKGSGLVIRREIVEETEPVANPEDGEKAVAERRRWWYEHIERVHRTDMATLREYPPISNLKFWKDFYNKT